ncbi:hypothetical protein [Micromonospora sp. WMMD998]|uniref:hypothetical protein n=1 Tax=Micromonospora sp. WMMD998 TaxID=3016092 RepID=UPI00249B8A17|nr:hypothetical protein [Micromonospora sp. WMMD998]WFE38630.1 hypothetical protein O7619_09400 [Micromonospora sp. WMMD998]
MIEGLDVAPTQLRHDRRVQAALRKWAEGEGLVVAFLPQKEPLRGYTDAYLALISLARVVGRRRTGEHKKLVKVHPADEGGSPESDRHAQAKREGGGFAERHMVGRHVGWHPVGDGRHLSFQDVANGGDRAIPMDRIEDDDLLVESFGKVVSALHLDWNRPEGNGGPSTDVTTVRAYVRRELTAAKALGAVRSAADRLGLDDLDRDWLEIDGGALPNPLRLAEPGGLFGDLTIRYLQGFAHGDLHGGNVLIPESVDGRLHPGRFVLVDLESYESRAPLTRDPVVLLLSLLLPSVAPRRDPDGEWPSGLPRKQADALLRYLVRPDQRTPSQLPGALADLVRLTYEAGTAYAERYGWRAEWRTQYLLSLAVHALVATTYDNLGPAGPSWCLRLAASALDAHRAEHHPTLTPPAAGVDAPRPPDVAWPRVDGPDYHLLPGLGHAPGTRGRHRARIGGRRRIRVNLALVVALGGCLVPYVAAEGASDRNATPPAHPSVRTETPPTSRGDEREPPSFAPVSPGRYAFTCLRVWSPDDLRPYSDRLDRFREERLWWTRERSGRRTVQVVAHGHRSPPKISTLGRGELTGVPPAPSEHLARLREQVAELLERKPPELRNAAGTLELVAEMHQFWPLSRAQREALRRLLAETDGVIDGGSYPDRAGRDGHAISADNGEGQRETLQFDERTGRLLSHEKIGAGDETLAYYLFLSSGWTDTIIDRPCVD